MGRVGIEPTTLGLKVLPQTSLNFPQIQEFLARTWLERLVLRFRRPKFIMSHYMSHLGRLLKWLLS